MSKRPKPRYARDHQTKEIVAVVAPGSPVPVMTKNTPMQRLRDLFNTYAKPQPDGCVLWTGSKTKSGYGVLKIGGSFITAHRVAWFICYGSVPPPGMDLDHLCTRRACVNVSHLEIVTHAVNMARIKSRSLLGATV